MTEILAAALSYAERGWGVIPLHSPINGGCSCGRDECTSVGKHPRTLNGLKDATEEEDIIREWWRRWPKANVGIVTGEESGLVVLDQDSPEAEEQLKDKHLPASCRRPPGCADGRILNLCGSRSKGRLLYRGGYPRLAGRDRENEDGR